MLAAGARAIVPESAVAKEQEKQRIAEGGEVLGT